ncbi:MAG: DNA replication protein [Azospirillaceae bacterium]
MTATRQIPLELPQRTAMGLEDFLVAEANAAAVAWIDRWPDWPGPALTLYGPPGSGKSHLVQLWRARSGAAVLDGASLAAEAAAGGPGPEPRTAVAVDDAEAAAGDPAAERVLLHLHNRLAQAGGHLLVASRRPPARWPIALPDLASRLRAAPAPRLSEPDDALLAAVLVKQFGDRQLAVDGATIDLLTRRIERSFAAARAVVARIDRECLARRRRTVTRSLAARVLDAEGAAAPAEFPGGE